MISKSISRKKNRTLIQRVLKSKMVRKTLLPVLGSLDVLGGLAIRTWAGAKIIGFIIPKSRPVLCPSCFSSHGLQKDAERIGIPHALPCPNCGVNGSKKLTPYLLRVLSSQFFVRGSVLRDKYGATPLVQFNEMQFQNGDYKGPKWLQQDIELISEKGKIGFFHYGPRLWMLGDIEPLEDLQKSDTRPAIIGRILNEFPERILKTKEKIYRLRVNPTNPSANGEYDSPPEEIQGSGRLDSTDLPVFYCSQDIEGCVHECRVTVEDELYLAVLSPERDLRLLDLTALLLEEGVTEFESLDMAIHMLFFAADHSYKITREIALAARKAGFDGVLYPSYFSLVRSGAMPFETVYGISVRRFSEATKYATSGIYSNLAIFGRPIKDGILKVSCIDRLVIHKVHYDFRFGPIPEETGDDNDDT